MRAVRTVFVALYLFSCLLMIASIELAARNPGWSQKIIIILMPVLGLATGMAAFIIRRYFEVSFEDSGIPADGNEGDESAGSITGSL